DLDLYSVTQLFDRNTTSGAWLNEKTPKKLIVDLVSRILNTIIPDNTIPKSYDSLDAIVNNNELATIVKNLLVNLNSNSGSLLPPVVNIVAQAMGLSGKSEFKKMDISGPSRTSVKDSGYDVYVYNKSTGINRGYTAKDGSFTQDHLWQYVITGISVTAYDANGSTVATPTYSGLAVGDTINGGDFVKVNIKGATDDTLIVFEVSYNVTRDDNQQNLTSYPLVDRLYTYVKNSADVDRTSVSGNKTQISVSSSLPSLMLFDQNNKNPIEKIADLSITFKRKYNSSHLRDSTVSQSASNFGDLSAYLENQGFSFTMADPGMIAGSSTVTEKLWKVKSGVTLPDSFAVGSTYTLTYNASATRTQSIGGSGDSYSGSMTIITYDDYGLSKVFGTERDNPRNRNDYASGSAADAAWANYQKALINAANYSLRPGMIANFTNADYLAKYETYTNELDAAVKALESYYTAEGNVDLLKTAVDAVTGGDNEDADGNTYAFDDPRYNYFGFDDFNAISYSGWKEARDRAMKLYNSQQPPEPPKALAEDATQAEIDEYNTAYAKYEADLAAFDPPAINTVDVTYAKQQVELWGPRLIKLDAVRTHLDNAITMCTEGIGDESAYTPESWAPYQRALTYAQKVAGEFDASTTMRTEVRTAMNNLIYAWKRLMPAEVVTVTFTFTVNGETHATLTGNQGDAVDLTQVADPSAPVGMHFVGWGNVPSTFDADASFEAVFANNTDTAYTINYYEMDTSGNYPADPTSSEPGAGETGSTATVNPAAKEGFTVADSSVLTGK
ncbi:MAG: hypothetical protein ACI4JR_03500, partial [Acutalibacteraceae bacterium]